MNTSRGPSPVGAPPAAGPRRRGRERALGLLYEAETKGQSASQVLSALPAPPEPYATLLFSGVMANQEEIDRLISAHAHSWALGRMPVIDRQILRVGTFELRYSPEIPAAVAIDEAIELAKLYSTEDSGRFVNGILAALGRELRAAPDSAGGPTGTEGP